VRSPEFYQQQEREAWTEALAFAHADEGFCGNVYLDGVAFCDAGGGLRGLLGDPFVLDLFHAPFETPDRPKLRLPRISARVVERSTTDNLARLQSPIQQPLAISHQPSAISHQPSAISTSPDG